LISLVLLTLIIPIISAADLTYKQYSEADMKVPCYNNGTWCSSSAVCNITITWPNGTILVNNAQMTNQGSFQNYTLSPSKTAVIGIYEDSMVCSDGGYNVASSFEHQIQNSDSSVIYLYAIAGLIYLMLVIFAWKSELAWIGFLAGVILSLPGIHLMINGFGGYDDLLVHGIAMVIIAIGLLTLVIFAYEAISSGGGDEAGEGSGGGSQEEDYDYFKS
jgi:hypothetical protein